MNCRNRSSRVLVSRARQRGVAVIIAIWIEKGVAMVVTGFIPSPMGAVTEYAPTAPEIAITVGVYAIGFFVLSVLYKVVLNVRDRLGVT